MNRSSIIVLSIASLFGLTNYGLSQVTNWSAYDDFWYPANQEGWNGNTTPNAWGYYGGNVNGNGYSVSQIGTFLTAPNYLLDIASGGGAAGAGEGTGDGNFVAYMDNQGWGLSLGRYTNGTIVVNGPNPENGYVDGGADFNGFNSYINVGSSASVNPSALTYSAWVNVTSFSDAYAGVISKSESSPGRVGTLLLKSNGKLALYFGATGGVVDYDGTGSSTLNSGQWYYITATYDSVNGLKGYVNGVLDGAAAPNGTMKTGGDAVWIGAHPTIPGRYFNGLIDEPRISTVARSANWVWAEWLNMSSNSFFNGYGPVAVNSSGSFSAWQYSCPIAFSGYTGSDTLTNFPALVEIGTNISGFAWSQYASNNGYELRFADSNGNELPYERDNGANLILTNGAGIGQVWVQVPRLNSSTVITAYWGNPAATGSLPAYCTNGAVWTNGFGGVWHLSNSQTSNGQTVSLSASDSTTNQNNGWNVGTFITPGGIGYQNKQYLWAQAANLELGLGVPTPDEGIASILSWTAPQGGAYIFSGSFLPGNSGIPGQINVDVAIVDSLGGTDLDRTVLAQGANATSYNFTKTMSAGDSVQFQVGDDYEVGAPVGIAANVTQVPVPAMLVSASYLTNTSQVSLKFAEAVYAPSATNVADYSISGVTVIAAEISPSDPTTVILTISPGLAYPVTLTLNGVENDFGKLPIASNSMALISVATTHWNAYNDFYFDSTSYANNSPGTTPPYPSTPSATGTAWGYYDCNVSGSSGYPSQIGAYFGPGTDYNLNQVLYAMANYQPLGAGLGQIAGGVPASGDSWNALGGTGLALYGDNQGWGTAMGEYGFAWFSGAPGYGTPYANQGGIYMVPGFLGNSSAEGIGNVITWTAPVTTTYTFTGDFLIADNNPGNDYAIVDSTGGVEMPKTAGAESSYNPFSFQRTLNAGDVVEFQVGSAENYPAYVGFNCDINTNPVPAVLVSAARMVANSSQVSVKFAAPLYPASVSNVANYHIDGVGVTSAALSTSDSTTVILTISLGLSSPTSLTVNGVENDFGHLPVAANSTALITVPVFVPIGVGTPINAAQDTFVGTGLSPYWQSGIANDDNTQFNYVFSNDFVWSNGVLHCHADNQVENPVSYWDPNYLIYVNPAYEGQVQNALMHLTIKNSNFSSSGVAGVGVCVSPDPYVSSPEGGDCLRTVPARYGDSTNTYPFFLSCSDYVIDEPAAQNTNNDVFNLSWKVGGSYWLRIQQTLDTNPATSGNPGGIVAVKVWAGDGSQPEPANWQYTWKDPLPGGDSTRSGYAAIRAGFGAGVVMDFDVDYFLVAAPGLPVITPTLPTQLLPQIGLSIAIGGGNTVLSWPAGVQSSYQLQSRSALNSGNWNNVNATVVVSGSENTVTVPIAGGQTQFFRLIQTQ